MSDSTNTTPLLFVIEAAHQVREALLDVDVRGRVEQVVRETIETQWQLLEGESKSRLAAKGKHLAWRRRGCQGKMPLVPEPNRGTTTEAGDWPFPVEHGISEPPGCVLLLAVLNDFAAEHPEQFQRTDCEFKPLLPAECDKSWGGGPWAIFGWQWVDAVANLTAEHEDRLEASVGRALVELGVNAEDAGDLNPLPTDIKQAAVLPQVDLKLNQIRFEGECFDVSGEAALLISEVIKNHPQPICASKICSKPARVKSKLPDKLGSLLVSEPGKGYRLDIK